MGRITVAFLDRPNIRLDQVHLAGGLAQGNLRDIVDRKVAQQFFSRASFAPLKRRRLLFVRIKHKTPEHQGDDDNNKQLLLVHLAAVFLRLTRASATPAAATASGIARMLVHCKVVWSESMSLRRFLRSCFSVARTSVRFLCTSLHSFLASSERMTCWPGCLPRTRSLIFWFRSDSLFSSSLILLAKRSSAFACNSRTLVNVRLILARLRILIRSLSP